MNSCNCTNECYDLGCYNQGDVIDTNELAPGTGTYIVKLLFHGIEIQTSVLLSIGDPIVFTHNYNEDYKFKFLIFDPAGNLIVNPDGTDWWCFTSTIKMTV
jgi:hypothetical protein